jgi:signal peptidase I
VATFVSGVVWGGYGLYLKFRPAHQALPEKEPVVIEYARSFFPILLIVLLLRSFLVEPFRIPSGSMMPTLLIGDFILVNKYTYGIRLPVLNTKIVEVGTPKRGDIVVFRFPKDPTVDYIKRVIGLPGDRIAYYNKQVAINGKPLTQTPVGLYEGDGQESGALGVDLLLTEDMGDFSHDILIRKGDPTAREGEFVVPEGQYFVMGDNRDNSNDSRFWGAVPEANLVGKAFFIWMSWNADKTSIVFSRLGTPLK